MKLYIIATVVTIVTVAIFQKLSKMATLPLKIPAQQLNESIDANAIKVSISGQINNPGTYQLATGATMQMLIEKAGGTKSEADGNCYDVSLILEHDQSYYIAPYSSKKVSLNKGNLEELKSLDNIGVALAEKIISYRQFSGGFKYLEEIKKISGIANNTFNLIKDSICL